ncbi:MAG: hypothetical protein IJ347_03185 [Faecalibacterium sp.]|nr:hypothetical protein [Faecalibacterium sp.]
MATAKEIAVRLAADMGKAAQEPLNAAIIKLIEGMAGRDPAFARATEAALDTKKTAVKEIAGKMRSRVPRGQGYYMTDAEAEQIVRDYFGVVDAVEPATLAGVEEDDNTIDFLDLLGG